IQRWGKRYSGATGIGRTVTYNAANKTASITQGSLTLNFADDVDHQRYKQTMMQGSTVTTTRYLDAFGVHVEPVTSATTQWNEYLMVGGSMVGVRFLQGTSVTLRYFHQDHLGSIAGITDASGAALARNAHSNPPGLRPRLQKNPPYHRAVNSIPLPAAPRPERRPVRAIRPRVPFNLDDTQWKRLVLQSAAPRLSTAFCCNATIWRAKQTGALARSKLIHKHFCVNGAHLHDITVTSCFACYRRLMRCLDRSHSCARPHPPKSLAGNAGGSEITPLCALVTIQM